MNRGLEFQGAVDFKQYNKSIPMTRLRIAFARLFVFSLILVGSPPAQSQVGEAFDLVELLPEAPVLGTSEAGRAGRAQQEASIRMADQQERISRWNVVAVRDPGSLVDRARDTPRQRVSLTLFPGVSFVIEHTKHRVRDWSLHWYGEIVEGGSGTVHVSVVPDDDNQPLAFVNILSDRGDFNISPTEERPYHIAVEMNPLLIESVD